MMYMYVYVVSNTGEWLLVNSYINCRRNKVVLSTH